VKGLGGCHIDSVSKRSDDKTWAVSEVLVTIVKASIGNSEDEVILSRIKHAFELSLPLEFIYFDDFLSDKLIDDIS
jgi:hypothetical protein